MEQQNNMNELIKALVEANRLQTAQNLAFMVKFTEGMEKQLEGVSQELRMVKNELNELQNSPKMMPMRKRLVNLAKGLEEKIHSMQKQLREMKGILNRKAGQIVTEFKGHGISALDQVTKVLRVKTMLATLNRVFEKEFNDMEHSIEKINGLEQKYREAVGHVKNAGRVLRGKEAELGISYPKKTIFNAIRTPYRSLKNMYALGMADIKQAIGRLEALEQAGKKVKGEKLSISEKLAKFKDQQVNHSVKMEIKQKGGQEI